MSDDSLEGMYCESWQLCESSQQSSYLLGLDVVDSVSRLVVATPAAVLPVVVCLSCVAGLFSRDAAACAACTAAAAAAAGAAAPATGWKMSSMSASPVEGCCLQCSERC